MHLSSSFLTLFTARVTGIQLPVVVLRMQDHFDRVGSEAGESTRAKATS
jgi:hypothetical protein